ncbi:E3 ubiquitin-protein ligase TRIM39 [Xenopus laevis]|uniref:Uncharacterized protein n=2 Tax=Xenopus laevis TaxID=8355 RepID=A0A974BYH1_XENLA|nr:E3 ubiquitin-protein ligase TRIM39 [Xenopus laevis]OCT63127.1 hypothetical protein XELAEV_18044224mg [Xenopus laevis]
MASDTLLEELSCSVCTSIFTDPVTLMCGHSFCQDCITKTWDWQEENEEKASCPECRLAFKKRPDLNKNVKLRNIVQKLGCSQSQEQASGPLCNYCINFGGAAVKYCLQCEALLCNNHVDVHSKSEKHVLCEPCTFHHKPLSYYCMDELYSICEGCRQTEEHRDHQVLHLNEASEKRKEKLKTFLQKLTAKKYETEDRIHCQEDLFQLPAPDMVHLLNTKLKQLSCKIHHVEKLCRMTDPFTVLHGWDPDRADVIDVEPEYIRGYGYNDIDAVGDLNEVMAPKLCKTLCDIVTDIKSMKERKLYRKEYIDLQLDINTAANSLNISDDRKAVYSTAIDQGRPESHHRFASSYVLSTRSFSSGRHYWEVEGSDSGIWMVGVAYPSIERKQCGTWTEDEKSWWLCKRGGKYSVKHNGMAIELPHKPACSILGIYIEYEGGRLSFFHLSYPVRHIYTYTATFTESLHAIFSIGSHGWVRIKG